MPNPVINRRQYGKVSAATLVTDGLFAHYFSSDFDASADGATIGIWKSQEFPGAGAQDYEWDTGPADLPTVSATRLCNGHHSVRFNGKASLGCTGKLSGTNGLYTAGGSTDYPNGIEMYVVYWADHDPPTGANLGFNGRVQTCFDAGVVVLVKASTLNNGEHFPFSDNNWYQSFGLSSRITFVNNTSARGTNGWHCVNVSTPVAGPALWYLDSSLIHQENAYTFGTLNAGVTNFGPISQIGAMALSSGYPSGRCFGLVGNIAAAFFYNKTLSVGQRTQMRAYLKANWGCTSF